MLLLTLYKKFFVEILNGDKKIEYRNINKYYDNKFKREHKKVKFTNGYGNNRPFLIAAVKQIIKTKNYYEIHLGKIIKKGNCKKDFFNL